MTTPPPYGAYPPPPYGGHPTEYYGYPQPKPTNALAIVSLVCAFVFAPLGILFGHMSLSQIKKTGEEGRGLAIAGLVISYLITTLTVLVIVLSVLFFVILARNLENMDLYPQYPDYTATPAPPVDATLPPFKPPATLGSNCQYPATTEPASKPAAPPRMGRVPTDPALVSASITTNQGNVGLQLDNAKAPCAVNNFASLAQQGFFDDTPCHRLSATPQLGVLQCGDPSALANSGPGTNGSQFFFVYQDSMLPPTYTVFGTIDTTGLTTLDKIAASGVVGGRGDGKPAMAVTIKSVRLD